MKKERMPRKKKKTIKNKRKNWIIKCLKYIVKNYKHEKRRRSKAYAEEF